MERTSSSTVEAEHKGVLHINKPYIICRMMTPVDGRIDRAVTPLKLTQVEKYGENAVWLRYAL